MPNKSNLTGGDDFAFIQFYFVQYFSKTVTKGATVVAFATILV